jgi:hypothetical protein
MKNIITKSKKLFIGIALITGLIMVSCEEYLDKAPAATITERDAFVNFTAFQGFVEVLYTKNIAAPDGGDPNRYAFGLFADEIIGTQQRYNRTYDVDMGNYLTITNGQNWSSNWAAIRIANLALDNLPLLVDATQEQKDFIKGQALFFRAYYHFEMMTNFGGLPYIDTLMSPTDNMDLARLNYRQASLKAAKDLQDAAALLPVNWDNTATGQPTLGNNDQRINKVMALGYLGKVLLYAASPMMNEESTGNAVYDADLCKQAAAAFGQALKICDDTKRYQLMPWAKWTDIFWVMGTNNRPGGTEMIMNRLLQYNEGKQETTWWMVPKIAVNNWGVLCPTNNYIKNYAMANGLPIDDPASGYNPLDPWTGREPRFYSDIIKDGDEIAPVTQAGIDRYANLYTGGDMVGGNDGSPTGYYFKKFAPLGCNKWQLVQNTISVRPSWMRLADVYLLYSEACLQGYGSASGADPVYGMTAEQALNVIRNRAQLPNITSTYTGAKDKFMGEIIRERAVEFSCELWRWYDLRRWNLIADPKYLDKTAIDFDRGPDGKPINIKERIVRSRIAAKRNNWLPITVAQTQLFNDFPQNPGW